MYDQPEDQLATLLPFIRDGLEGGERCIWVVDDSSIEAVREALSAYGVDVRGASDRGALCFWTRDQWRQPGVLDSVRKSAQVQAILDDARASGFSGVRAAVEMTWTLAPDIPVESVRHWEATIDAFAAPPDMPLSVVCQYSRERLAPARLEAGLRTHRLVVIEAERYSNPYFEGSDILSDAAGSESGGSGPKGSASTRVQRMLSHLQRTQLMTEFEAPRFRREEPMPVLALSAIAQGLVRHSGSPQEISPDTEEALSAVSHELRTPVATILGTAQLLARLEDMLTAEERAASVTAIVEGALHVGHVLDDLFVLAHVDGQHQLLIEPVALRHAIEHHIEDRRRRHPERRVQFAGLVAEPAVDADPCYFDQILNNLLDNAELYSPPGAPILVSVALEGQYLAVRVIDEGPDVEPDQRELIFGAFAHTTGSTRCAVGAGLAASKRLVEAHGGSIWTGRHSDGGTEFGFTLPLATEGDDYGQ